MAEHFLSSSFSHRFEQISISVRVSVLFYGRRFAVHHLFGSIGDPVEDNCIGDCNRMKIDEQMRICRWAEITAYVTYFNWTHCSHSPAYSFMSTEIIYHFVLPPLLRSVALWLAHTRSAIPAAHGAFICRNAINIFSRLSHILSHAWMCSNCRSRAMCPMKTVREKQCRKAAKKKRT